MINYLNAITLDTNQSYLNGQCWNIVWISLITFNEVHNSWVTKSVI